MSAAPFHSGTQRSLSTFCRKDQQEELKHSNNLLDSTGSTGFGTDVSDTSRLCSRW